MNFNNPKLITLLEQLHDDVLMAQIIFRREGWRDKDDALRQIRTRMSEITDVLEEEYEQ